MLLYLSVSDQELLFYFNIKKLLTKTKTLSKNNELL